MPKANTIKSLQAEINDTFIKNFGRTPLRQRLEDISKESFELCRFTDLPNLKEEAGDLLASTLQLCSENEWDARDLILSTLQKIERRQKQYQTLGRKVYCAILGGSFDPITNGHIKLAQFVLNSSKTFDTIWITPCFSHMFHKKMANSNHRIEMCKLAAKVDGRIKVFDYEIANKLKGETYHFLKRLLAEDFAKDKYDFSYIIGLDNANAFDKWVNYEDLERMMRFVIVNRQGVERDNKVNWYLKPPHIYLAPDDSEIPLTSSTVVRESIRSGELRTALKMVDPEVYQYIIKNGLYKKDC